MARQRPGVAALGPKLGRGLDQGAARLSFAHGSPLSLGAGRLLLRPGKIAAGTNFALSVPPLGSETARSPKSALLCNHHDTARGVEQLDRPPRGLVDVDPRMVGNVI